MKKEKKNRVKGIFGTVLFHALLLLLLSLPFMSLTYQDPPPKKGGGSIAINFSSEINTKPVEEIIESTEEIVTQTTTDALVVKKPKKKKKKPKEEVIEEKKPEVNKKALYPGKKKTTITSEGEGEDKDKGDGGDGDGGDGDGDGVGNGDYQLGGRKPTFKPTPQGNQVDGKVVVAITVDRLGNVITASTDGVPGSTTFNKQLLERAKKAALETKFEPKQSAPTNQQGKIIYYFQLN